MTIIMVKKRLEDGSTCKKCEEAESMLRRRGAWKLIDEVIWADEGDPKSAGLLLAERFKVEVAPFFIVGKLEDKPVVYTSALKLHRSVLKKRTFTAPDAAMSARVRFDAEIARLEKSPPLEIVRWALETYGPTTAVAFSGAEDVAVIDLAFKTGLDFEIFTLDTGRLHPETLRFIENVRVHYGLPIQVMTPDADELQAFVTERGLFSFFEEGHTPCCAIRKVEPLRRALNGRTAWLTGQRRDQNPATRGELPVFERDTVFGEGNTPLLKFNPLAAWTSDQVWAYLHREGVPTNQLHAQGYRSIGCAPCTRPVEPEQHEREGRWWWEDDTERECGLHVATDEE